MIAIHDTPNSFSSRWVKYCDEQGIPYKLVDCYNNNIIEQLIGCSALMWHFHHASEKDFLFAKQLITAVEFSGIEVFPNTKTCWHFDDKIGQKYLLESIKAESVDSFVFYSKKDALTWLSLASFPKVFKLRGGAGSVNVKLVKSLPEAKALVRKAFGRGFKHDSKVPLSEIFKKYLNKKLPLISVIKGVVRLGVPTRFSKIYGKEKGYVYFQEFIPNNDSDIRVIVVGDKAFAIKRMVRENDFRASGSGTILYDKNLFDDATIKLSFDLSEKLQTQCVAFDYVYKDGLPLVVEFSFGFSPQGYDACVGYWDKGMTWHAGPFNPYGWMVEEVLR